MFYHYCYLYSLTLSFFFFNDTATTEIYTLSLHDALPISGDRTAGRSCLPSTGSIRTSSRRRSEEHTSELQSPCNLVCRLLLEKKKKKKSQIPEHYRVLSMVRYISRRLKTDNVMLSSHLSN